MNHPNATTPLRTASECLILLGALASAVGIVTFIAFGGFTANPADAALLGMPRQIALGIPLLLLGSWQLVLGSVAYFKNSRECAFWGIGGAGVFATIVVVMLGLNVLNFFVLGTVGLLAYQAFRLTRPTRVPEKKVTETLTKPAPVRQSPNARSRGGCPACGRIVKPGAVRCLMCGHKMEPSTTAPAGKGR